jgi:peptidyl-prolyl isomerase D
MSEPTTTERKLTFFDVSIAGVPAGRIVVQLYNDLVPKTAENFRPFLSLSSSTSTRTRSLTYLILVPP